jgi:hypothetical protein
MNQTISINIAGGFPSYQITFSADPASVPFGQTATITYALASKGFKIHGINLQRDPFASTDEMTWAVPKDSQSLILTDVNSDPRVTQFGLEIIFEDSHGNRFSSTDPVVVNEGED